MGLVAGLALGPQTSRRDRAEQLPLLEQEKRVTAFRDTILEHDGVALAYFGAEWCPACRTYAPEVKKVVDKAPKLGYAYVDIDAVPRLAEEWDVQAIPVTILFHEGEEVARFTGAVGAEQLRRAVEEAGEIKRAGA
jgi:thioredoxin-like negative regulator of GroEL